MQWAVKTLLVVASIVSITSQVSATAVVIYENDFEGAVGTEWSSTATDVTPVGARRFLGQFASDRDNEVFLTLSDIPEHPYLQIEFDLFIIRSWDGDSTTFGADLWELSVVDGPTLESRRYSQEHRFADVTEEDTLGYLWNGLPTVADSVYHRSYTFPHSEDSVVFRFFAETDRGVTNESWGLDNVRVSLVPEPSSGSLVIIASCMASFAFFCRNRRRH
ncbi:MAG: hypothetical protein WDZ59_15350 [Pirellulales bacterium]